MIISHNAKSVSESNPIPVELLGSNAEEVTVFNGLAITDTAQHSWTPTAAQQELFAKAKEVQVLYTNTHDQSLNLSFDNNNISIQIDGGTGPSHSLTTGSGFIRKLITKDEFSVLKLRFTNITKIAVQNATTAPTTGSITLKIILTFG